MRRQSSAPLWIVAAVVLIGGGLVCLAVVLTAKSNNTETPDQKFLADSQEAECKLRIKTVEQAVMGYYYKNQEFPKNLSTLTDRVDGKTAYLHSEDIIDPWGKPFVYEPKNLNKLEVPRITSTGAPGRNKPISNW